MEEQICPKQTKLDISDLFITFYRCINLLLGSPCTGASNHTSCSWDHLVCPDNIIVATKYFN